MNENVTHLVAEAQISGDPLALRLADELVNQENQARQANAKNRRLERENAQRESEVSTK